MPKKSDTREKVFSAADTLLREGVRPTQQNVRDRIGSGSITTINSALNAWWSTLTDRMNRKDQHPELPEPVIGAANKLWDQALAYAHHSFKKEREEVEAILLSRKAESSEQFDQLRATADQLQQQNALLRANNDTLHEQCMEVKQKLLASETLLIRATSERDETNRINKQLEIIQRDTPVPSSLAENNQLLDARVEIKVNLLKIKDLESLVHVKNRECNELAQQLLKQERAAVQQQHRLELVLAQQDARYDEALKALTDCKNELSLAKSKS
ncbi:DNA-binding protein [Neptunomonas sp.]|uniref:DNA-binding protein n=1 Tax=Neptunomonas sp. TaxID=1971898 RepID=UPI0025FB9A62|nr:DNA-binding protein [Neptunomonas sp.]